MPDLSTPGARPVLPGRRGMATVGLALSLVVGAVAGCDRDDAAVEAQDGPRRGIGVAATSSPAEPQGLATEGVSEPEQRARRELQNAKIALAGVVLNDRGAPVAGARVSLGGQHRASTGADGRFVLEGLPRRNGLLEIDALGFRRELVPVHLFRPLRVARVTLDPLPLVPDREGTVRFVFGGDTAFGRRFLDPSEVTPRDQVPADHPEALIQASDPEPGTRSVVQYLRPIFQEADYGIVNLETPVLDEPATPYPYKDYVFFTLPDSLRALDWLGVDYVSLGNNHVYDYLDAGVTDTMRNLEQVGLAFSGAGLSSESALQAHTVELGGHQYALLSAASITGGQYPISFVADDAKGGAANARLKKALRSKIEELAAAGYHPIVQLHTGNEYTFEPTEYAAGLMETAARAGADLVIGHHPHVAQGFAAIDGTLVAHSLGNLFFDQDRLETMLSFLARIDMAGGEPEAVRAIPVYIEDYRPRLISGELADVFLRRIGEVSRDVLVYPYNGQGWVALDPEAARAVERAVEVDVTIPAEGVATLDLRPLADSGASLAAASIDGADARLQLGRDLMAHGGFEDWDVDEESLEAVRWDVSSASAFPCLSGAYRGAAGLCIVQQGAEPSVVAFRNSIRVMGDALDQPNKDLTLLGYVRGETAGKVGIVARYTSSEKGVIFGEEMAFEHPGGSFDWQSFAADLDMPPDDVRGEGITSAGETEGASVALEVAGTDVNVRQGPTMEAAVLMQLDEGDEVAELRRQDEWIRVAVDGGDEGWIHESLVRPAAADGPGAAESAQQIEADGPQPRAVRLFLVQEPVEGGGQGTVNLDEFALVSWGEPIEVAGEPVRFDTPHPQDFLRLTAQPGEYRLALTFRAYRPAAVGP
jgi:hypothetical protein